MMKFQTTSSKKLGEIVLDDPSVTLNMALKCRGSPIKLSEYLRNSRVVSR